jgi:polyphosphate kinase 2 (PPK2 family)
MVAGGAMTRRSKITLARKKLRLSELEDHQSIDKAAYFKELGALQLKLQRIQQAYLFTSDSAIIVFEGWDAAGKGGTIRRMSAVLDPRGFKVWPIAAPRAFEKERHYLFRFWERLPPHGAIAVFDRSWYGRVLVERVEGMAAKREWQRAYDEINEFERFLIDHGTRVVKLFLHITQDEQLRRFEERLRNPLKRWKLSYDDFRNRRNWPHYERAVEDMVERTSTLSAPWHVIPANHKLYARIACMRIVTEILAANVDLSPPPLDERAIDEVKAVLGLDPLALSDTVPARPALARQRAPLIQPPWSRAR